MIGRSTRELSEYGSLALLLAFCLLFSLSACSTRISLDERRARAAAYEELMTKSVHAFRQLTPDSMSRVDAMLKLADELVPRTARVADAFGCLALRKNKLFEAREFFLLAVKRDPLYARAYAHLGFLSEHEGRIDEARAWYEKAIHLAPLDLRNRWNYGGYLYTHASKVRGLAELEKARSLLPVEKMLKRSSKKGKP